MATRLPKFTTRTAAVVGVVVIVLAGAVILTRSPLHLAKTSVARVTPQPSAAAATAAPSPSQTPAATETPAVAGAATQAPAPARTVVRAATPKPSTPTPVPVQYINLSVDGQKFTVNAAGVTNACNVLVAAKNEGKISSLTIYDSPQYIASHGNSAYVYEINGISDLWQYRASDAKGVPQSARGCSLTPVEPGYSVTWYK